MSYIITAIISASVGGCVGFLTLALIVAGSERPIPSNRRMIDAADFRKRLLSRYIELSENAESSDDHIVAGAVYGTITLLDRYVEEVYGSADHNDGS